MDLTKPVSAIHVVDNLRTSSGGPSRSVTAICDALTTVGAQVTLVAAETDASATLVRPSTSRVHLHLVATNPRTGLLRGASTPFGRAVADALPVAAPTVVHTHGLWVPSNRAAALVARSAGSPLVISPKGMLAARALRVRRTKKQIGWHLYQRQVLQQAAAFQATSQDEADDIRRLGFRQPVALIPHGVSVFPQIHRVSRDVRTALFLSRFHPIKGLPDLVDAWSQVRPPGWRLKLVGPDEGGHRDVIRQLVKDRGMEHGIEILDAVGEAEKQDLFSEADLFVLATHSENFGVVIAEALAAAVPVLTTRAAPWSALEDQRCGWWVDPGATSIADALREATSQPSSVLQDMGERGRSYVRETLSWDRSATAHLALYRWLWGQGSLPASVMVD